MTAEHPDAFDARETFLNYVRQAADYWAQQPHDLTPRKRCDGVAFSILCIIDGVSGMHPALDLCLSSNRSVCLNPDVMLHEHYYDETRPA